MAWGQSRSKGPRVGYLTQLRVSNGPRAPTRLCTCCKPSSKDPKVPRLAARVSFLTPPALCNRDIRFLPGA